MLDNLCNEIYLGSTGPCVIGMQVKTIVNHWRFEDGMTCPNPDSRWPADPLPRGWYCWVYPKDDAEFVEWMSKMCPTADITHRFNSGDPMYTTYIKDDAEATLFQLKWR